MIVGLYRNCRAQYGSPQGPFVLMTSRQAGVLHVRDRSMVIATRDRIWNEFGPVVEGLFQHSPSRTLAGCSWRAVARNEAKGMGDPVLIAVLGKRKRGSAISALSRSFGGAVASMSPGGHSLGDAHVERHGLRRT